MEPRPATEAQRQYLFRLGYEGDQPETTQEANELIDSLKKSKGTPDKKRGRKQGRKAVVPNGEARFIITPAKPFKPNW
jgi:hypothetical protein